MFSEISKAFGKSFLVANLAPASLLCAALAIGLKAATRSNLLARDSLVQYLGVFGLDRGPLLLVGIIWIALLFNLLGKPLSRLYQGYVPRVLWVSAAVIASWTCAFAYFRSGSLVPRSPMSLTLLIAAVWLMGLYLLQVAGLRYHRRQYRRAVATIQTDVAHRARNEFYHLRHYPRSEGIVLPTLFGNIRRSAEHYAFYMFGLDPITTWIRLIAVIPAEYAERIAEAESSAAFFINCSAVGILMALGCTYFALALATYRFAGLSLSILAVAGAYGSYRLACRAASDYGEYLRSAFDLYRFDLLRRLAIERPESQPWTLEVERTIWQRVQEVMFWADPESAVSFRPDPAPATASRGPISE